MQAQEYKTILEFSADTDYRMGGEIMAVIVKLPECPDSVIAKSLVSGRKYVAQQPERKRL